MCVVHDIETHRHRPQREKAITAYLTNPAHLKKAAQELTRPEQELLIYLLGKEGWALLSAVSRKFGKMEGDGFTGYPLTGTITHNPGTTHQLLNQAFEELQFGGKQYSRTGYY